jgi:hypothetical protein
MPHLCKGHIILPLNEKKNMSLLTKVLKLKLINFRILRHYSFFFLSTIFSFLLFDIIIATH